MICAFCGLPENPKTGLGCKATVGNIPYGNGTLGQVMAIGDSLPNDHGLPTVDLEARCHTGPTRLADPGTDFRTKPYLPKGRRHRGSKENKGSQWK